MLYLVKQKLLCDPLPPSPRHPLCQVVHYLIKDEYGYSHMDNAGGSVTGIPV